MTVDSDGVDGSASVKNPHTDYVKLLPEQVPLPTFYNEEERQLLSGTSLHAALDQKLSSIEKEFEKLCEYTQNIPWCQKYWWHESDDALQLEDWMLVDALYRSRSLELPGRGPAVVPCIDMANHASRNTTTASYEIDEGGQLQLQIIAGRLLTQGQEVTISYGDDKGACEMLFSYGFLEPDMEDARTVFLDLDIADDDPLRLAKMRANKSLPGIRLTVDRDKVLDWESDYVWWSCVNEEDGLDFVVTQETDGQRKLEMHWKGESIDSSLLPNVLQDDPMWDIFRLRALVTIQQRVNLQMSRLDASEAPFFENQEATRVRNTVWTQIGQLRDLERGLLSLFDQDLDQKVSPS
jgi:hypothetical protein